MSVYIPRSVLVYSMGEVIGDGLIKLPFVAGLRKAFPEARIHWCAATGSTVYASTLSPVVEGLLDRVLLCPPSHQRLTAITLATVLGTPQWPANQTRVNSAVDEATSAMYDLVIDTQLNFRRTFQARALADRFVTGARGWRALYGPKTWPEPLVDQLDALLWEASLHSTRSQPVRLTNARALAAAEALLPAGPRYVGFAPGAGGAEKRWPLANYIGLAGAAAALGLAPVFFLGPDEADDADAIRAGVPGVRIPELNRTDAFQDVRGPLLVIAMAARLTAAVANDAGPGHMFAAGGAPLLSLQKDRRKAVKFRPAARRLEMLVAEDYGAAMAALPLDAALDRLRRLVDL